MTLYNAAQFFMPHIKDCISYRWKWSAPMCVTSISTTGKRSTRSSCITTQTGRSRPSLSWCGMSWWNYSVMVSLWPLSWSSVTTMPDMMQKHFSTRTYSTAYHSIWAFDEALETFPVTYLWPQVEWQLWLVHTAGVKGTNGKKLLRFYSKGQKPD